MIIAITGYIGAGKSTTAEFFKEFGFDVINVDELGHDVLDDNEITEKLKAEFGMQIIGRDLKIDRKKLSSVVFNKPENITVLNKIVHPQLKQLIRTKIGDRTERTIIDVALLKELKLDDIVEKVILVQTDITKIYQRLSSRYTKAEIINIMNTQDITSNADFIIENNDTKDELRQHVYDIVRKIGVV